MKIISFILVYLWALQLIASAETDVRIIGGTDAVNGQAPHQCSLQRRQPDNTFVHYCGCSIENEEWILTAAHCLEGRAKEDLTILVGTNDLSAGGVRHTIVSFIIHPEYNWGSDAVVNDIGLIRVKDAIEFNEIVQPIELSTQNIPPGSILQLTGWGKQSSTAGNPSNHLQTIDLKLLEFEECQRRWLSSIIRMRVQKGQLCTLNKKGEGACLGDSGSPLTFNGKLIGMISYLMPCAVGLPDVFTEVAYHLDWIHNTIHANASN